MKKVKDIFKKSRKRKLPPEWQQAFEDAAKVANPMRDLECSRLDKARAAFVVIALGGKEDLKAIKKLPRVKQFMQEIRTLR